MPNYTFHDEDTGKTFTATMTIAEMEEYLETVPNVKWVPVAATPCADPVRLGRKKPDAGFRDLLKTIQKGSPKSNVNTF